MHVAAVLALRKRLLPALERLRGTLAAKAVAFEPVIKIGRTRLTMLLPAAGPVGR